MSICISVYGRFHAFQLAKALEEENMLDRLITSMPMGYTEKFGINKPHIKSLAFNEIVKRCWQKLPHSIKKHIDLRAYFQERFDLRVKKHITKTSKIFVGWSGSSLASIEHAKKLGMKTIVERGSTHIQYQHDTLQKAYQKLNLTCTELPHPKTIERELAEYEAADYISIPSQFVKKTFIEKGITEKKLIVNPYGVDLNHFEQTEKNDDVFRIIFCGKSCVRKGTIYLLEAFKQLNLANSELWLVGHVADEIKPLLKKYQQSNIHFKGSFHEFELANLYSQSSVFCLPSIEEGLAMVIPQAMACGLPVICTENSGGGEIIRDKTEGFIIRTCNTEALAEKITWLYENQHEAKIMGEAGKIKVREGFSWGDYGNRMVKTYQEILTPTAKHG